MSSAEIGLIGVATLLLLLALRFPIGLALIGISGIGIWVLLGRGPAWGAIKTVPFEFTTNWALSAVPMFLLMGYICYYGGMTTSLFELSKALLARVPGSLAVSSIFACSGFAAVSGSSVATAAAMGRIAIPEMVRAGYDKNFACGAIAAGGTIGALIPPSVIMILFGIFAQVSIIQLFIGGIGIGLLTAASYIVVILLASWLRPDLVPRAMPTVSKDAVMASLLEMGPIILLILGVFGGLFGGIFTTTEAGAVGAGMACVIALAQRRLAWDTFFKSITETVATCGAIFVIGVGATLFTRFLSLSGTGDLITTMVTSLELGYWELMILIVVIHLVLGCFIDGIGAMLITLPIFLPILHAADLDLVWYGVFLTKMIEIGMITPPFGLNVFVIKSVVGDLTSLVGVFRGIVYFLMADLVVVFLVLAFPIIILYLPQTFGI